MKIEGVNMQRRGRRWALCGIVGAFAAFMSVPSHALSWQGCYAGQFAFSAANIISCQTNAGSAMDLMVGWANSGDYGDINAPGSFQLQREWISITCPALPASGQGAECSASYLDKRRNWVEATPEGYWGDWSYTNGSERVWLTNQAKLVIDRIHQCTLCDGQGNPIHPLYGSKQETQTLGRWLGLTVSVVYDSRSNVPKADSTGMAFPSPRVPSFATAHSSVHKTLFLEKQGSTVHAVHADRGSGTQVTFWKNNATGKYVSRSTTGDWLEPTSSGWTFFDAGANALEYYDTQGVLGTVWHADGRRLTYAYSNAGTPLSVAPVAGLLISIQDQFGRAVRFEYESAPGSGIPRIKRVVDPADSGIVVLYNAGGYVSQLTWPDGKSRQFVYDSPNQAWALTGIIDEGNKRYATFGYDAEGRATSTEYAGGVNRYSVTYTSPPMWQYLESPDPVIADVHWRDHTFGVPNGISIQRPNGEVVSWVATSVQGNPRVSTRSQPAGAGCNPAQSSATFDSQGNLVAEDDFNGNRACYGYDLGRRLRLASVMGLASSTVCTDVLGSGASLPAGSRKVSSLWHPDWRLKTRQAEPGRLSTWVYNGQPDPFNGNVVASCAPSGTTLPTGQPIPLLCKRVEQATTDQTGARGFSLDAVPATAGDPHFAAVGLLLHANGLDGSTSFVDHSASPKAVSVAGNAAISIAQSKFGGASAYFDGSGDYLTIPHHASFDVSTGDFTIEAWVRPASNAGMVLLKKGIGTGYAGYMIYLDAGKLYALGHDTGGAEAYNLQSTATLAVNTWNHIALTRAGSTFRLFVNGALQPAIATSAATLRTAAEVLSIGANSVGGYPLNGYLDDVRITKGVARYTAAFTPPTAEFGNAVTGAPATPSYMDTTVPNRVWTYSYNQQGQVLTAKGPRTDVNATTTYTYHAATTADYTIGDLHTVKNAVNQLTTFPLYDKHGQPLRMIDINSVTTNYTYDQRQRLRTLSVGGQTTTYDYHPNGLLKRVTQPDAITFVDYGYDDARRLTSVSDNLGNRIEYTLDNAGHRKEEKVKDPVGALRRQLTRSIDALGRVQQTIGRE